MATLEKLGAFARRLCSALVALPARPAIAPVVARALLLFLGLALIKLALIVSLADEIFEAHWRLRQHFPGLFERVATPVFLALLALALARVIRECRSVSDRAGRVFSGWFVALGLLFALLIFHEGRRNYLYPVMEGILNWRDLWAYLQLNLFFRPPYLAVWLAGLALVAWGLIRSGRVRLLPWWVAGLGLAYAACFWRPMRSEKHEEMMLALALGAVCLGANRPANRPLSLHWLGGIGVVLLIFVPLLAARAALPAELNPYFVMIALGWMVLWTGASWFARRHGYWISWSQMLPFFAVSSLLFTSTHYPLAQNYNHVLGCLAVAPRHLLHELLLAAGFFVTLRWAHARWGGRALGIADATALGLVLLALGDLGVAVNMRVRVDWDLLEFTGGPKFVWPMVRPYLKEFAGVLLLLAAAYFGGIALLNGRLRSGFVGQVAGHWPPRAFPVALLIGLLALGQFQFPADKSLGHPLGNLALTSPVVRQWREPRLPVAEFERRGRALGLLPGAVTAERTDSGLNLFLIIMESSYNKYLSLFGAPDETQPLLSRYRDRMELFPNYYGPYPTSIHARVSVFSGLYNVKRSIATHHPLLPVPTLFDVLHERGRRTSVYDSCTTLYQNFRDFLSVHRLDVLHDATSMPGRDQFAPVSWGLREECTLAAVRAAFRDHATKGERFFLTYLPVAPHHPFDTADERFSKFPVGDSFWKGDFTGQYKNELLYMDWVIATMIDTLRELGLLDTTLIVITNDHGEMLGENGGRAGHGWHLDPGFTNIPLIIMDPRRPGYRVNHAAGSHVDVLPTVLDRLGISPPPGELYQGVSLFDINATRGRTIYLNSHGERGLVRNQRYFREDPPAKSGAGRAAPADVYAIRHEGTRSIFEKLDEPASITGELDAFEEFQNSLIRHYAHYREALRSKAGPPVR